VTKLNSVRNLALWLVLALLTLPAAATEKSLLWKVEGPGMAPSYLLATMHSSDPRIVSLPPSVERALHGADSFTMEMLLDESAVLAMGQRMLLTDGSHLGDLLEQPLYRKVVVAMEQRGMPEPVVAMLKPWAVFMTLSMPPEQNGVFLDLKLYQEALQRGIKVYGLESMEEQLVVFDEMAVADQVVLLRGLMQQFGEYEAVLAAMTEAYLGGDLDRLVGLSEGAMEGMDEKLQRRVMDRLVDNRNLRMAERLAPRLGEGNAFIAVGALHLPGEKGLIALLRERGYQVTPVFLELIH
jgi:uncharacterized protein YbaP (TraB family)